MGCETSRQLPGYLPQIHTSLGITYCQVSTTLQTSDGVSQIEESFDIMVFNDCMTKLNRICIQFARIFIAKTTIVIRWVCINSVSTFLLRRSHSALHRHDSLRKYILHTVPIRHSHWVYIMVWWSKYYPTLDREFQSFRVWGEICISNAGPHGHTHQCGESRQRWSRSWPITHCPVAWTWESARRWHIVVFRDSFERIKRLYLLFLNVG